MNIDRIKLRNWRRIDAIELSFQPGINLIYGPNETGKSTIIEAIRMGLSGNPAGGSKEYRQLIPWGAAAKAEVELDILAANKTLYRIFKSFPKGEAFLAIPAKGELKLAENADVQTHLNRILGIESGLQNLWDLLFVKQGEVLDIIDPDRKKNPLEPGLKLHIEEILRETAQKELNQFQQTLEKQLNSIFTATGKLAKNSAYHQLLIDERDSGEELSRLDVLERELLEKAEELEESTRKHDELERVIKEHTLIAGQLKQKKETAYALEKEELKYKPLEERYQRLLAVGLETGALERELPLLLYQRNRLIEKLAISIAEEEKNKSEARQRLEQLKIKKAAAVVCDTNRLSLEKVDNLYNEIRELKEEINRQQTILPHRSSMARDALKKELANIETRLEASRRLKQEMDEIELKIKEEPLVTEKEITLLRAQTTQLSKQKGTLEAARSRLELQLHIEPITTEAIDLFMRKDNGNDESLSISRPTAIDNFLRLELQDAERYRLEFSGSMKELDLQGLEASVATLEAEIERTFARFRVRDLQALETHYRNCLQLSQHRDGLRRQLEDSENPQAMKQKKLDIEAQLRRVEVLSKAYPLPPLLTEEAVDSEKDPLREALFIADRLDELKKRLDERLEGTSLQQLELAHRRLHDDYQASERRLMVLEPLDINLVDEHHIEKQIEKKNEIQRRIDRLSDQKRLLEEMNLDPGLKPASPEEGNPAEAAPQELRDQIDRSQRKLEGLRSEETRLLDQETATSLRDCFLAADSRLRDLKRQLALLPPEDATLPEEIAVRTDDILKTLKELNLQLKRLDERHHRLMGEIGGHSVIATQKDNEEARHRTLLDHIRKHITAIAASRLLLELLARQKARMHEQLFAPIQERVSRAFARIVGDRYRITISDDLGLDIRARIADDQFEDNVRDAVSFGTREQLSFIFRLAIAEQLSKREPQVMILDDSFVNTDQERLEQIIDIIQKQENIQFLIFTCKKNDYARYRSQFNCIDLTAGRSGKSSV